MRSGEWTESYYRSWLRLERTYQLFGAKYGLSYNGMFLLHLLYLHGPQTQTQLAGGLTLPKQTVSFLCAQQERAGRIARRTGRDRRSNEVCLTEQGRHFCEGMFYELSKREERAYERMTQQQRELAVRGMEVLADYIEESFQEEAEQDGTDNQTI